MKILSVATAILGVGFALAAASPASAAPVTVNQDPTTVKMVCGKHGGTYGPPDGNGGGAVCLYPDGTFQNCDVKNNCTLYPPSSRTNVTAPIVQGTTGEVG
jgi:hypothetical protein